MSNWQQVDTLRLTCLPGTVHGYEGYSCKYFDGTSVPWGLDCLVEQLCHLLSRLNMEFVLAAIEDPNSVL